MKHYNIAVSHLKNIYNDIKEALIDIKDLLLFFSTLFIHKETVLFKKTNDTIWLKVFNLYLFIGLMSNDIFFPGVYVGKRKWMRALTLAVSARKGIKIGIALDKKHGDHNSFVATYRCMMSDSSSISACMKKDVLAIYIKNKKGLRVEYMVSPLRRLTRFLFVKKLIIHQESFDVLVQKELYKTLDNKPAYVNTTYVIIYKETTIETRLFNCISILSKKPVTSRWEAAPGVGTNNLHRTNKEDWILLGENTTSSFCLINAINALTRTINPPG